VIPFTLQDFGMRVLTGLIASCLAALASSSQVYELHDSESPYVADVSPLSPAELTLALSQRMGVSKFHKLGHNGAVRMQHLNLLGDDKGMGMFQEGGGQEQFVLSIAGMSGIKGMLWRWLSQRWGGITMLCTDRSPNSQWLPVTLLRYGWPSRKYQNRQRSPTYSCRL
jgi:hypothetical protein